VKCVEANVTNYLSGYVGNTQFSREMHPTFE